MRRPRVRTDATRPVRRAFAMLAVTATAVLVIGIGGTRPAWYLPVYAVVYALLGVAGVLVAGGWYRTRLRMVYLGAAAILALPLIQLQLHTTVDRSATETTFLHLLAVVAVFWLVAQTGPDREFDFNLLKFFALAGGALAVLGMAGRMVAPGTIYGAIKITTPGALPMGPFINRNDFAAAIELLLPAALVLALSSKGRVGFAWLLVAGCDIASVIVSESRGGVAGTAVEILLVLLAAKALQSSARGRRGRRRSSFGPVAALVALTVLFAVASGLQPVLQRFHAAGESAHERIDLDRSSVTMGASRPILGFGLGTWSAVYPSFARFDNGLIYDEAHCEYAQWWAETGMVGAGLLLLTALAFGFTVAKGWPHRAAVAGSIALAGFAVHASVDFLWHIPGLALLFAAVAGSAISSSLPDPHGTSHV